MRVVVYFFGSARHVARETARAVLAMFASALAVRGRQRPRHLYPSQIKKFDFDSFSQSPLFSNPFDGMA
jgi:hypothetical protein